MVIKQFPSKSSSATYTTRFDPETGESSCDCRGWTQKRLGKPRGCTHTRELEATTIGGVKLTTLAPKVAALPETTPLEDAQGVAPASKAPTVKPQLASAMKEDQTLADFIGPEWIMEEKFDGHRLFLVVDADKRVSGWSRPGGDRPSAERKLPETIVRDAQHLPAGIYDGELYIPGGTSSDVVRLDLKHKLVFVIFDAVEIMGVSMLDWTLERRRAAIEVAVAHVPKDEPNYVTLATQESVSIKTVQGIWDRGGEGAILKRKDSLYKSGWRTPNWIKVKAIAAAELTITGFEAGKNGPNSVFKLRHDDGRETTVKVLTNELLARVHANPKAYVGRRVTISYMGLTSSGVWRHPIFDHFVDGRD